MRAVGLDREQLAVRSEQLFSFALQQNKTQCLRFGRHICKTQTLSNTVVFYLFQAT